MAFNARWRADAQRLNVSNLGGAPPFTDPLSATSSVQSAVLAGAPHLASLALVTLDAHLTETFRLRKLFSSEKACDEVVDLVQRLPIQDPLPRAIWQDIILDRLIAFDKLHAALDSGFDWNDEPRDFAEGFAIVKKDHLVMKKQVRFEGDWTRVFNAWEAGVCTIYPHRRDELLEYGKIVMEVFRAAPEDPGAAIYFDAEVCEKYSENPFRMDDRSKLQLLLLARMFSAAHTQSWAKRAAPSGPSSSSKRSQVVCEN